MIGRKKEFQVILTENELNAIIECCADAENFVEHNISCMKDELRNMGAGHERHDFIHTVNQYFDVIESIDSGLDKLKTASRTGV